MNDPMELSVEECLDRLAGEVIGRLAITTPEGPRIVPLNYGLVDDAIVFRTTPYSEVARYAVGREAAFEVDCLDHAQQTGWSVVLVGQVEDLESADLANMPKVWVPRPWVGGVRNRFLQLRWRTVTGRRLGDRGTASLRRLI